MTKDVVRNLKVERVNSKCLFNEKYQYISYSTGRARNVERACFLLDFIPSNKSSSVEIIQLRVNSGRKTEE